MVSQSLVFNEVDDFDLPVCVMRRVIDVIVFHITFHCDKLLSSRVCMLNHRRCLESANPVLTPLVHDDLPFSIRGLVGSQHTSPSLSMKSFGWRRRKARILLYEKTSDCSEVTIMLAIILPNRHIHLPVHRLPFQNHSSISLKRIHCSPDMFRYHQPYGLNAFHIL